MVCRLAAMETMLFFMLGIVDELADGAARGVQRVDQRLNLVHQPIDLLDGDLAGADHVLMVGAPEIGKLGVVGRLRAGGVRGVDIDVAVAQHAGRGDAGGRIGVQVVASISRPPAW